MNKAYDLSRFILAQQRDFETAYSEIKSGRKRSHWMWYIFPQIDGLGHSPIAKQYAIKSLEEAQAYLENQYLGDNMQKICQALLECDNSDPNALMGYPDDLKLRSSMTLFAQAAPDNPIFKQVLDKFYEGNMDPQTLRYI